MRHAVECKEPYLALRILQVQSNQPPADHAGRLQCVWLFGDQLLPSIATWLSDIGGDDAVPRRIQISLQEERVPLVSEKLELRVESGDPRDHRSVWRRQVEREELVGALGAAPNANDQPVAIVGDLAIEAPFLLVLTLVDQLVFSLFCPQRVIEKLLEIVHSGEPLLFVRLVVATVIKAFSIRRPVAAENLIHFSSSLRSRLVSTSRTCHSCQSEPAVASP